MRERTPRVAVLSPLVAPSAIRTGREGLTFLAELRARSDLAVVPYFADALPDDIDVLLVIDATVLKRSMLRSIDRFVAGGGTLIVLVDPFVRFNRASQRTRPAPSGELDDITDLLAAFGFRFDVREVVGDASFAAPVSIGGAGASGYPFWIRVPAAGLAASHPVTGALRELLFAEPGALKIEAGRGIVPLAFTSGRSGVLARERYLVEIDELDIHRSGRMFAREQAIDEPGERHAHRHRRDAQVSVELAAHDADLLDHGLAIGDDALRPLQYPPALVGESLKPSVTRMIGTPISSSRCLIALDSVGWETLQRVAARPKCPSCSSAIRY